MIEIEKRITKFRIWNQELKTMDYNGGFIHHLTGYNIDDCKYLCLNRLLLDILDQFDVMLFTSAHDKEGKEIYEGDIVKWKEYVGKDESIISDEFIFGLVLWDKEECGFVVSQMTKGKWTYKIGDHTFEHDTEFYSYDGPEFDWKDLEVIGNIYENPDIYNNLRENRENRENIENIENIENRYDIDKNVGTYI